MELKDIFEIKKIPSVVFFVIAIVGGFLFYGGEYVLIKADPKTTIGFYSYIIWLISCGLLVTNIVKFIFTEIKKVIITRKVKREYKEILESLDPYEVSVIREFFLQKRHALNFPYDHPVISGLVNKSVIFITSTLGTNSFIVDGNNTTFTMNKYMREIINPNTYFGLNSFTKAEIDKGRPNFLNKGYY